MRHSLLIVMASLALSFFAVAARAADPYPNISIKDLKTDMQKHSVTILDANGTESYKEGHIPGAIDFDASGDKLESILPKDKNALIVAYCGGPECPLYKAAAEKAVAMGYTNVRHLSAGISGWKQAGEKTDKG